MDHYFWRDSLRGSYVKIATKQRRVFLLQGRGELVPRRSAALCRLPEVGSPTRYMQMDAIFLPQGYVKARLFYRWRRPSLAAAFPKAAYPLSIKTLRFFASNVQNPNQRVQERYGRTRENSVARKGGECSFYCILLHCLKCTAFC